MITNFQTNSFYVNDIWAAVEQYQQVVPGEEVMVVMSHLDAEGRAMAFAYCADEIAVAILTAYVREIEEGWAETEEWDEMDHFPGGELARGWANESAAEYAKIAQQNAEDAAVVYSAPSYMGIRGSYEPDGGIIYEP